MKTLKKQQRKCLVFIAEESLLTKEKNETDFQSFIPVIRHLEMHPDQETHQNSIKMP